MERIKIPLNFRLQNFLFLDNGKVFWTSASKTLKQKFTRWRNKDHSQSCNLSNMNTLPIHGQSIIGLPDGRIYHYPSATTYNMNGDKVRNGENINVIINYTRIKSLSNQYQQGVAFEYKENSNIYTARYVVYGTPSINDIEVYNLNNNKLSLVKYQSHTKWYWKYWEAEGIQILNDEVYIGISVKTIFGAIFNYIHKVEGI